MPSLQGHVHVVKKSEFAQEKVAFALKQANVSLLMEEALPKHGQQRGDLLCLEQALSRH